MFVILLYLSCVVDLSSWRSKIESDEVFDASDSDSDSDEQNSESEAEARKGKSASGLPDLSFEEHDLFKDGVLTIGCVGKLARMKKIFIVFVLRISILVLY